MGIFDTVSVPCPNCGEMYIAQSKGGDSSLAHYDWGEAPDEVMFDINRHAPFTCEKCGTVFKVHIQATYMPVSLKGEQ